MLRLDNKVAVITGGASGIGKACALLFSRQGAKVAIADFNADAAQATANEIIANGGEAFAVPCNVADQGEVVSAFKAAATYFGQPIDILVSSAGLSHIGTLLTTTPEDLDRMYNVNVKGVYNAMFAAIQQFMESGKGGVICNLASIASTAGIPDRFAYSMTKGAVLTMSLSAARDYIHHKIRVNCVSPARVHTPFVDNFIAKNYPGQEAETFQKLSEAQPIGRMGTSEEIAGQILYLCSEEASFITGANHFIDGGFNNVRM